MKIHLEQSTQFSGELQFCGFEFLFILCIIVWIKTIYNWNLTGLNAHMRFKTLGAFVIWYFILGPIDSYVLLEFWVFNPPIRAIKLFCVSLLFHNQRTIITYLVSVFVLARVRSGLASMEANILRGQNGFVCLFWVNLNDMRNQIWELNCNFMKEWRVKGNVEKIVRKI